jgi:D-alanyl-D-alanine carboxypeptidase
MQRRPPEDDQQNELAAYELETQEEQESYGTYATRIPRRKSSIKPTRSLEYNDDAFPHRPKVLRASRLLSPSEFEVRQDRSRVQEEVVERPTERRQRNTPLPGARQARKPYRSPLREETGESESVEEYRDTPPPHPAYPARPKPQSRETGKIVVIPPVRRPPQRATGHATPQPPRARPAQGQRRQRQGQKPLLVLFQEWPYHKPAMIIVGTLVALLILVPVLSNIISSATHRTSTLVVTSAQTSTQKGTTITSAANPHELVIIPSDTDHPPPPVFAQSAYLLDADTGVTLYAYNPFMHLPMLSTTKLMTAVIAVQKGNPNQPITITPAIKHDIQQLSADSSIFGMKQGETYSLRDLLYGLFLVSGNDAAVAIADTIDGSQARFVADMNQHAKQLGLYDTHYVNPHGLLDPQQYSSAHDLAILARYALNISLIHQISGTEEYHIPKTATHQEHFLINENQFMWWYPGVDGGKTGYDGASDFVQVVSVTHNHHHLIGVVIHTNNWWTDMRDLMNWGFDSFTWVSPYIVDFQHPIPYDTLWNFFVKDKQDNTVPTADGGRYYIYTGYSISGPIMKYFDSSGGLKKFGYPTGMPKVPNGQTINQQFQHGTIQCNLSTKQCQTV